MSYKFNGYAKNVTNLEARAIAAEAVGDYLGANKLYHEAMKHEAITQNRAKEVERLRRLAASAYHSYEILKASQELL